MIDKEQLKKIIKSCEESIKNLTIQLNELKGIARENGIMDEISGFNNHPKLSSEVSKKRQEILDSMKKVRDEAQASVKKAMDEAMSNISSEGIKPFLPTAPSPSVSTNPFSMPFSMPSPTDFLKNNEKIKEKLEGKFEKEHGVIMEETVVEGIVVEEQIGDKK